MATSTAPTSQARFYREFLMARHAFDPHDYGVNMDSADFADKMVDEFNDYTRGQLTLDEMLLHPRSALHFCDVIRQKFSYFSLPDDIILRSIMIRRKNPAG